jgi:hypothetical protein
MVLLFVSDIHPLVTAYDVVITCPSRVVFVEQEVHFPDIQNTGIK